MIQSCLKSLGWTLGTMYLLTGWSHTETAFLEKWSMSQVCQSLRRIWAMSLKPWFNC